MRAMRHRYDPSAWPPAHPSDPETGPAGWRETARRRVRRTTVAAGALGVALTGLLGGLAAAGHTTSRTATTPGTSASQSTGTGSSSSTGSSTSPSTGTGSSAGSAAPTISTGAGVTSGAS